MAVIGIDLGTTNSVIARFQGGSPEILENLDGHRKTPSVVSLTDEGFVVGQQAQNQLVSRPGRTVSSIKRYIGTDDPISLGDRTFTSTELSSAILEYLKRSAEDALGTDVTGAVITVPAYFDHRQRIATKEAAQLADLDVLRILNEPTAACLPYGLRERGNNTTVLVYDLGGGTFDISIVDITDGVFDVLGTDGDDSLGGDDWDGAIVDWLLETLEVEYDVSIPDPIPLQLEERLFDAAQTAKHELSSQTTTNISIPFLQIGTETITFDESISREEFAAMNTQKVNRTVDIAASLWENVAPQSLDEIILVGGSTRMPMIRDALERTFGMEPLAGVRVDEAVARGAAIQASILEAKNLPDVAEESTTLPSVPGDNNDEIVLIDSTPKALGVETYEHGTDETFFSNIIPRHASIPARNTRDGYCTREDFQRYINLPVLQSKTATLEDAEELDTFKFGPVPERPAGAVEFSVEFTLTEDGTLIVAVEDAEGFAKDEIEIRSAVATTDTELAQQKQHLPALTNT